MKRQFDFFGTWHDSQRVVEGILAKSSIWLIPDRWYANPECELYEHPSEELEDLLKLKPRFYIVPKGSSIQPSGFVEQRRGPRAGMYRIELPKLCLGVDVTLPRCRKEDHHILLSSGSVFVPKEFWLSVESQWILPPEAVKRLSASVVETIKRLAVRRELRGATVWMGTEAALKFELGEARIRDIGV